MVFENDHGAEVNIWGAWKLIVDAVVFLPVISPVMLQRNITVKCKINFHTTIYYLIKVITREVICMVQKLSGCLVCHEGGDVDGTA
jgi:hypothetical protein